MTKQRGAVLGLVVVLLMGLQHFGLEKEAETLSEAPMKRVAGLPASEVLPTYIATLFFGAFRAVAVDILWIQLRKVEEEKRWYERREILKLISYVQPRNPEVWSHLGWHSAYNVANGFTDPEKSWEWVKFGLLWLRRGVSTLPNNPYLKDQLAYTLWHKAAWRDGELDMDLLKRIEGDAELQAALLPDGVTSNRPLNAFELAIPWLEQAREELLSKDFELTQMGLYLYPDTMDGFIRYCLLLAGMYEWKRDRPEEAKAFFRRAQRQCEDMVARAPDSPLPAPGGRKYRNLISTLFKDFATLYAQYPDIVDLEYKARGKRREDEIELLKKVQGLLQKYGPIDEQWLWSRSNPHVLLNRLKQSLSNGEDVQECNDQVDMAWPIVPGPEPLRANLAPEGLDIDLYWITVAPPPVPEGSQPPATPPRPVKIHLAIPRPTGPCQPLKVTFHDAQRRAVRSDVVTGTTDLDYVVGAYGRYLLRVESNQEPPWLPDTRYGLKLAIEQ
ncbi:MAG TPA: hypothetical protein VKW04_24405 [Planctomycetota bacterium]|nr:hypothetical protein [Planctomycetota bacterium]